MTQSQLISGTIYRFFGLLMLTGLSWALPNDKEQPIHIQSNSAEIDDSKGVAVYRGNVNVEQGSVRLEADEVTVHSDGEGIIKVIAAGDPAHYQQQRDPDSPLTHAYGGTIEYRIREEVIQIIHNARLEEDENSFSGERIDYDMKRRTVNAYSNNGDHPTDSADSRVEMIIQPKSIQNNTNNRTE